MTHTEGFEGYCLLGDKNRTKSLKESSGMSQPSAPYWCHFLVENPQGVRWLETSSGVDAHLVESLLSIKVRPRSLIKREALLLILRVNESVTGQEYEQLRSLRMYVEQGRIITTSICHLPIVQELIERVRTGGVRLKNTSDVFMYLTSGSIRGLEVVLEELEDRVDQLERAVLEHIEEMDDSGLTTYALDALDLRRYLVPQREAMFQVCDAQFDWLNHDHVRRLQGIHERVSRQLEEVQVLRDRLRIIREQRNSYFSEQANQRLYVFSVAAVVFLPLSFFTGLLGVNLGGIPGAEDRLAFEKFCALLILFTCVMIVLMRRFRWL